MDFSPFDESLLATCSGDGTVSSSVVPFIYCFCFLLELSLPCCSALTLKFIFHPCCFGQGFQCDMHLLCFCNSNRVKTSSQQITLRHRCPGLQESAECVSASSDSAVCFTTDTCINTLIAHTPDGFVFFLSFASRAYCFTCLAVWSKLNWAQIRCG